MDDFNLEETYGGFLDLLETHISQIDDEPLTHYGVKGMRWGVRKDEKSSREPLTSLGPDRIERKTASGETIVLSKNPPTRLHRFLDRVSKNYREEYKKSACLTILDSSGKRIGEAQVSKKNDEELDLIWLGINRSARGKGYATAVMQAGAEFGRQEGFKRLTLEVPGNSPDARHIYEKLGFKVTKVPTQKEIDEDPTWGGLTEMVYEVDRAKHTEEGSETHSMSYTEKPRTPEELLHYGVKGMKWGVRKAYTTRKSKELSRLNRVARGRGSLGDNLRTTLGSSTTTLARGRGVEGAARIRRDDLKGHLDRINSGKATARDVLRMSNGLRVTDVARGVKLSRTRDNSKQETARQRNRRLNKQFTKSETAKRDAQIDAARQRSMSARENYLKAKAQYQVDKKNLGTRAARAKLNEVRRKNAQDFELANQAKSGLETTMAVLGVVGGLALVALSDARR